MDFANLDLRTASERGSWVHFEYRGEPIFADDEEGKPSRILIRGIASKGVLDAFRRAERLEKLLQMKLARVADKEADEVLKKHQADTEAAMDEMIVAAAGEWENIIWDGKALEFSPENVLKVCGSGTLFFGQVVAAIKEMHRLFTSADSA